MSALTAPPQDVVARARDGDEAAFSQLYEAYRAPIQSHLYRMTWDWERAEELAADAWLKVWLALPTTRRDVPLSFQAFLFRVATNVARDHFRHEALIKWTPWDAYLAVPHPSQVADDDPTQEAIDHEVEGEVRVLLDGLPPRQRQALTLWAFHTLDYDEIGTAMGGLDKSSVKGLMTRARDAVRARFDARHPETRRPAPETCPVGVHPRWSTRREAWRYRVSVDLPRPRGQKKTSRGGGSYDTLAEATRVLSRARHQLAQERERQEVA